MTAIPTVIYIPRYVLFFQEYRRYEYDVKAGTMTRIGDAWSIDVKKIEIQV